MTLDQFRARHPEFRSAGDSFVQAALDDAALEVDPTIFLAYTDKAIRLKAAHALAMTPFGRSQRLVADDGTTIYLTLLKEVAELVAVRMIAL